MLSSTIVTIHFKPLIQRNGRVHLDSLYCFSTNLSLTHTHLKNMNGLVQTLQRFTTSTSAAPHDVTV